VKKLLFITGILLVFFIACKGPLAKKDDSAAQPEMNKEAVGAVGMAHMEDAKTGKEDLTIEPAQGGITISELFKNKKDYSGKIVKIKGKVTKVNPAIMGKNWIHLQDGTDFEGQFDLTVTSDVIPETGNTIIIEGKVALDKDFGYGYAYPLLLEEAKIIQ
jgi:hypothetical protein